jgi:crotonobetainyl-CoA:carnitine CoA-transferase CaiB-like acyl-CoA transferase
MSTGMLSGARVLDLSNVLAGPFCTYQLALLGADVIKVEVPGSGDLARQLGADPGLSERLMGASFLAQNSNKRSLALDLKKPAGIAIFRRLVATADVLVENFRPGVMNRLGLSYDVLSEINQGLIYCAISGFGQDGPMRGAPAYDQIIQGLAGAMSITGDDESAPMRVGYPVADSFGGMTAAFAIAAALAARASTGRGRFLDVSMLDSMIAGMGWVVSNYLIAGRAPEPMGNDNFTAAPSGTFRTADGLLNIAANKQEQFESLVQLIGRQELASDPRFAGREARKQNRAELSAAIEEVLATRPAIEWEARLNAGGVPAGRVLDVPEALSLDQVRQRGLIQHVDYLESVGRPISVTLAGFVASEGGPAFRSAPPRLAEHGTQILAELGCSDAEIEALRADEVI